MKLIFFLITILAVNPLYSQEELRLIKTISWDGFEMQGAKISSDDSCVIKCDGKRIVSVNLYNALISEYYKSKDSIENFDINEEKNIVAYVSGKAQLSVYDYVKKKHVSQIELTVGSKPWKTNIAPSGTMLIALPAKGNIRAISPERTLLDSFHILNNNLKIISTPTLAGEIVAAEFLSDDIIILSVIQKNKSLLLAYNRNTRQTEVLLDYGFDPLFFTLGTKSQTVIIAAGGLNHANSVKVLRRNNDQWEFLSSSRIPIEGWRPDIIGLNERTQQHVLISAKDKIQIWNNSGVSPQAEFKMTNKKDYPQDIKCSPSGNLFAAIYPDGQAELYAFPQSLKGKKKGPANVSIINQRLGKESITKINYSSLNNLLLFGDESGNAYVFDLNIRKKIRDIKNREFASYMLHPWDKTILYQDTYHSLLSINFETGIKKEISGNYTNTFDVSPDGNSIAFGRSIDSFVKILDYNSSSVKSTLLLPSQNEELEFLKFDQQSVGIIAATWEAHLVDSATDSWTYMRNLYYANSKDSGSTFMKVGESVLPYAQVAFSPNSVFMAVSNYSDTILIYPLKDKHAFVPSIVKKSDFAKFADSLYNTKDIRLHALSELFFYNDSTLGISYFNENIFRYSVRSKKIIKPILNDAIVNKVVYPIMGSYFFQSNFPDKIQVMNKKDNREVFAIKNTFTEPLYAAMGAGNKLVFASKNYVQLINLSNLTIDSAYTISASLPKFKLDTATGLFFYSDMGGIKKRQLYNLAPVPAGHFEAIFQINTVLGFSTDLKRGLLITARSAYLPGSTSMFRPIELTIEDVKAVPFKKLLLKKEFQGVRFEALEYDSTAGIVYLLYFAETDRKYHVQRIKTDSQEAMPDIILDMTVADYLHIDPKTQKAFLVVMDIGAHELRVFDLHTWRPLDSIKLNEAAKSLIIDHRNSKIIIGDQNGYISTYDLHNYTFLTSIAGHEGSISTMSLSAADKLITLGSEGTINYWNLKTMHLIGSLYLIGKSDYLFVDKDGYYMSTKNGVKAIAFQLGSKVFPVEQLDAYFNRPDIILRQLDSTGNAPAIQLYEMAINKRASTANLNGIPKFNPANAPKVSIQNAKQIPYTVNKSRLTLEFRISDSLYKLKQFQIWINNVPVYRSSGRNLIPSNTKNKVFAETLVLSEGDNKIEISAVNQNNDESARAIQWVNYQPTAGNKYKPKLYLFTVAVNKYKNPDYDLNYATNDGRKLLHQIKLLKNSTQIITDSFYNQKATKPAITKIKDRLRATNVNDKVIILFSGHGTVDTSKLEFYFGTYDIDFTKPSEKGLSYSEIENLLSDIPARNKLILIDACHSGLFDKDQARILGERDTVRINGSNAIIKNTAEKTKDAIKIGKSSTELQRKSFELMQDAFWNTQKSDGTFVITASAGDSYAIESPNYDNGVFTYAVVSALQSLSKTNGGEKRKVSVKQLSEIVTKEVIRLTSGRQKPQLRKEYIDSDWNIVE